MYTRNVTENTWVRRVTSKKTENLPKNVIENSQEGERNINTKNNQKICKFVLHFI